MMSHKMVGIIDWKIKVGREFPRVKQRVDLLYKEHEKAEQEVVAEILRPDDLQLDVDIRPAKQPHYPNLNMLVKDDSHRTIKIDDEPHRVLPEVTPRARRLGPISVRHKKLPGMERFDSEKRKATFDALTLKKRRNTHVLPEMGAETSRLKPMQRARLNNLIAAQMARDKRHSESVEFSGNPSLKLSDQRMADLQKAMGNTTVDGTTNIDTTTTVPSVRQLHFKPDLIRFGDRRNNSAEGSPPLQKNSVMQTEHLSPSAMGLPSPVSHFKPGHASRYREYQVITDNSIEGMNVDASQETLNTPLVDHSTPVPGSGLA